MESTCHSWKLSQPQGWRTSFTWVFVTGGNLMLS